MSTEDLIEPYRRILAEAYDLHERKAKDYGTGEDPYANMRESLTMGIPPHVGVTIRMNDKMVRIKSILKKGYAANESLRDSYLDLVNYAAFAVMFLDEQSTATVNVQAPHDYSAILAADLEPLGHRFDIPNVDRCSVCGITGAELEMATSKGDPLPKCTPIKKWSHSFEDGICKRCGLLQARWESPKSVDYAVACSRQPS